MVLKRFKFTPDPILNLETNEVFVFGANSLGHHGGGSARAANLHYGAVWGEIHRTGRSYGLVTMQFPSSETGEVKRLTSEELNQEFKRFFAQVELEKDKHFLLTKVGLGIAGWSVEEVKKCFLDNYDVIKHQNLTYPIEFFENFSNTDEGEDYSSFRIS